MRRAVFVSVKIMCMFFMYAMCLVKLSIYGLSVAAHPSLNLRGKETADYSKNLIFPDSAENTELDFYPEASAKCRNQTFCEDIRNYPSNLFYEILESTNYGEKYSQYFRKIEDEAFLQSRIDEKEKYFLCPSTKMVVYPKAAYNLKHQLKFIYNLDSYRQGVIIEVCVKKSRCKLYDNVRNFKTRCTQKFVKKLLLTADENGKPYVDRYIFPSACKYDPDKTGENSSNRRY